jgi:hypothetical protein
MSNVSEYKIIENSFSGTVEAVNNAIKNGWTPIGGISIRSVQKYVSPDPNYYGRSTYTTEVYYSQAMVKYK